MELEGKIIRELKLEEGTSKAGNPWKKKGWVLETLGQYPRTVKFDVFGDRALTMTFEVGKTYAVSVDAQSREWNERWYTDLTAYASRLLDVAGGQAPQPGMNPMGTPSSFQNPQNPFGPQAPATDFSASDPSEDLPF